MRVRKRIIVISPDFQLGDPLHPAVQRNRFGTAGGNISFCRIIGIRPLDVTDLALVIHFVPGSPGAPVAVFHIHFHGRDRFSVVRNDHAEPWTVQGFNGSGTFNPDCAGRQVFRPSVPPEFHRCRSAAFADLSRVHLCPDVIVIVVAWQGRSAPVSMVIEFHPDNPARHLPPDHLDQLHLHGLGGSLRRVAENVQPAFHDPEFSVALRLVFDREGQPFRVVRDAVGQGHVLIENDVLSLYRKGDHAVVRHISVRGGNLTDDIGALFQLFGLVDAVRSVDGDRLRGSVRLCEFEGSAGQRNSVFVCFLKGDLRRFVRNSIGHLQDRLPVGCQDISLLVRQDLNPGALRHVLFFHACDIVQVFMSLAVRGRQVHDNILPQAAAQDHPVDVAFFRGRPVGILHIDHSGEIRDRRIAGQHSCRPGRCLCGGKPALRSV